MEREDARLVVYVRAAEEADPEGEVMPVAARAAATRECIESGNDGEFLVGRARRLEGAVAKVWKQDHGEGAAGSGATLVVWAILVGSVVLGLAADVVSGGKRINVLAFPLVGLMLWNLFFYGVLLVRRIRGRGRKDKESSWLVNLQAWSDARGGENSGDGFQERAESWFKTRWRTMQVPALSAYGAAVMHLAAALLVTGVVAGMYWRGLANEYTATWESTFLSEAAAQKILDTGLKPAALLSGKAVPRLNDEASREDTARWIHLFALTAGIVVLVPRFVLAGVNFGWGKKELARFELSGDWSEYVESLRAAVRGGSTVVRVVPFSYRPESRGKEAVRGYVVGRWGGAAVVEGGEPVTYGEEDEFLDGVEAGTGFPEGEEVVLLFNFSATPEDEVHGHLVRGVNERTGGRSVTVLLDCDGFRRRSGQLPEYGRRVEERGNAWRNVLAEACEVVVLLGTSVKRGDAILLSGGGDRP